MATINQVRKALATTLVWVGVDVTVGGLAAHWANDLSVGMIVTGVLLGLTGLSAAGQVSIDNDLEAREPKAE